jgi:hypothetical protein
MKRTSTIISWTFFLLQSCLRASTSRARACLDRALRHRPLVRYYCRLRVRVLPIANRSAFVRVSEWRQATGDRPDQRRANRPRVRRS